MQNSRQGLCDWAQAIEVFDEGANLPPELKGREDAIWHGASEEPAAIQDLFAAKQHLADGELPACEIEAKLRGAGLRPTRQRKDLARLLFGEGDRHTTAEGLHAEALAAKVSVSLATVYNTLKQFTECGLLREVAIGGSKAYFTPNLGSPSWHA